MSTDHLPPEPSDTAVTGRVPEQPPAPPPEAEPLLAQLADEDQRVLAAELVEELEEARPRRRRPGRRPDPDAPPHPGFWWAILWCILMLIVCQFIPAVIAVFGVLIYQTVRSHAGGGGLADADEIQQQTMLPAVALSQLALIIFSVLVLRLVVGREWRREVALRLPTVTHVVLAVLLWPALTLSASAVYLAAKELPALSALPSYFVTACGTLGLVGTAWGAVRLTTGRDWTKVLARQQATTQLAAASVGCLAVAGVAALIFRLVNPYLPSWGFLSAGLMEQAVKQFRNWPPGLAVLIIGLGPGLGEELWCRAFLGRGLVGRHGVVMGVILASLFFGAIHLDPHQGTMAAVMGLALHFSYLMTRSLWVPMLLHFLNNSLSVIADKLPELPRQRLENIDTDPAAIPWQLFAASAFLAVAVGWALYASRGRLARVDGSGEPPWQPPFAGVAHPPPGRGTAVVYSWPGVWPTLAVIAGVVGLGCAVYWF
jgi:membrane protease YdiL (CAAX protease family)